MIFTNREHAGELLARQLVRYRGNNPLVLAIPRGAVPMARVIADTLRGELDVVLVRKLRYPDQPELAVGAIDESGKAFLIDYAAEVDASYLEAEKKEQLAVIRRRRALYTPGRGPIDPNGRIVIVVDDGIATGSTMISALRAVGARKPRILLAAAAVASIQAARAITDDFNTLVCLDVPAEFYAVGRFFKDFSQVSDEDVVAILRQREKKLAAVI